MPDAAQAPNWTKVQARVKTFYLNSEIGKSFPHVISTTFPAVFARRCYTISEKKNEYDWQFITFDIFSFFVDSSSVVYIDRLHF